MWAAGDAATWLDPAIGRYVRNEHRLAATEQGRLVGADMCGAEPAQHSLPYFWSDQYDLKLQSYGTTGRDMAFAVVEGSLEEGRFVGVYGRPHGTGGPQHVEGVLGNGMARALRTWRKAVLDHAAWPAPALTTETAS